MATQSRVRGGSGNRKGKRTESDDVSGGNQLLPVVAFGEDEHVCRLGGTVAASDLLAGEGRSSGGDNIVEADDDLALQGVVVVLGEVQTLSALRRHASVRLLVDAEVHVTVLLAKDDDPEPVHLCEDASHGDTLALRNDENLGVLRELRRELLGEPFISVRIQRLGAEKVEEGEPQTGLGRADGEVNREVVTFDGLERLAFVTQVDGLRLEVGDDVEGHAEERGFEYLATVRVVAGQMSVRIFAYRAIQLLHHRSDGRGLETATTSDGDGFRGEVGCRGAESCHLVLGGLRSRAIEIAAATIVGIVHGDAGPVVVAASVAEGAAFDADRERIRMRLGERTCTRVCAAHRLVELFGLCVCLRLRIHDDVLRLQPCAREGALDRVELEGALTGNDFDLTLGHFFCLPVLSLIREGLREWRCPSSGPAKSSRRGECA